MNKSQFLSLYIYPPNEAKIRIRMLFNTDAFMRNNTIKVTTGKVSLQDALSYYVPKYKKNGKRDTRSIEQQIEDPDVSSLTVGKAMHDPAKWDLKADTANLPSIEQLKPVPVATDLKSGKTLLLDSSHVITSIIATAKLDLLSEIDIVHITGTSLEDVICDFEILNRP